MNIYDTKPVRCMICDKIIGEIDFDAKTIRPQCGQCAENSVNDKLANKSQELESVVV